MRSGPACSKLSSPLTPPHYTCKARFQQGRTVRSWKTGGSVFPLPRSQASEPDEAPGRGLSPRRPPSGRPEACSGPGWAPLGGGAGPTLHVPSCVLSRVRRSRVAGPGSRPPRPGSPEREPLSRISSQVEDERQLRVLFLRVGGDTRDVLPGAEIDTLKETQEDAEQPRPSGRCWPVRRGLPLPARAAERPAPWTVPCGLGTVLVGQGVALGLAQGCAPCLSCRHERGLPASSRLHTARRDGQPSTGQLRSACHSSREGRSP